MMLGPVWYCRVATAAHCLVLSCCDDDDDDDDGDDDDDADDATHPLRCPVLTRACCYHQEISGNSAADSNINGVLQPLCLSSLALSRLSSQAMRLSLSSFSAPVWLVIDSRSTSRASVQSSELNETSFDVHGRSSLYADARPSLCNGAGPSGSSGCACVLGLMV
eukprot:2976854-Rhodomonas_salina.2